MMPPLLPGGTYFFDPVLDPVWAAIQDVGLPISQHGVGNVEPYNPPGFASILTLAIESGYYSTRSAWQMIAGGVFDRFPALRIVFVETQVMFLVPAIARLDKTLSGSDDWMAFARSINRDRSVKGLPSEYFATNCYVGVSPFSPGYIEMDELVGKDADQQPLSGFHIGSDAAMFGVDYPHFETIFPDTKKNAAGLAGAPSVTEADTRKILFENAARVYDFDLDLLQPEIERVAFDLGAV
jgi:predicted TIM-barrel fold metal-dependent hydrolase